MVDRRPQARRKPTLVSGLALIELLLESPAGQGLSDLARAIGMDVGQTHRLLAALIDTGYVWNDAEASRYMLTPKLVQLAGRYMHKLDLARIARPVMQELRATTGETVHLVARYPAALPICIARELSLQPVAVTSDVGQTFELETSAVGQAIAGAQTTGADRVDPGPSFAVDRDRHRPGVTGIAAAIRDWNGSVVGALAVSGPSFRIDEERIAELGRLVSEASAAISGTLGDSLVSRDEVVRS